MPTILLVEDNPLNTLINEDLFSFQDVPPQLVCLGTAEEALEHVAGALPSLILMDIRLPGMSGLEAIERLKGAPATAAIPIWALTAHAMKGDADKALAAGCDQYFTKPLDTADLMLQINRFLENSALVRSDS